MTTSRDRQLRLFPHLRFSPYILKRLGEELNPNPDHGLIELVRNAFDADAHTCRIRLENVDQANGRIVIEDDGVGMNEEGIENHWLVLGQSAKSVDTPTKLGRIPVGSKGLGRLAALRLGSVAELISRPETDPQFEYHLRIDWDRYDEVAVVEDVELQIRPRKRMKGIGNGTLITLTGLKQRLARNDVTRLARSLLLLGDPFSDNQNGFDPRLESEEFKDLETLVKQRYFRDAEYHLSATLDANGRASARVLDFKGSELYAAKHDDLRRHTTDFYQCPAAQFDLWAFILDKETFSTRETTVGEVKEWLAKFGGVHLYLRGFRVSPYGDRGNDWLDIDRARVKSPDLRPGTNTSIGRVAVEDPRHFMKQKTDRSGLIEDEAFRELKLFVTDALDWMARRRTGERDRKHAAEIKASADRFERTKQTVDAAIEELPTSKQKPVKDAFDRYEKERAKQAEIWRKEVQLYRTLSTAGITAAVFAHESKKPVDLILHNAKQIEREGRAELGKRYADSLERPVERVKKQAEALKAFGNLTLSQIDHDKRRLSRVELHDVLQQIETTFEPLLKQRKVELVLNLAEGRPYFRASEAAIEAIVTNLLTNSLRAFEQATPGHHRINWTTTIVDDNLEFRAADNGPGIQGIDLNDIWLPGETTYLAGTGLGLAIVRDTVRDLGGSVDALATGTLGGAEIIIYLPILGA
jgi:signal transduction histidine kinase